ncbi:MAG: restriction endonuclease subunit S [Pseudomonadota bacterium]
MRDLPVNWTAATLGQLSTEPEQVVPAHGDSIRYIDIGSIDRVKKLIVNPQTLRGEDAPSRARKRVSTGDTLVSMTRPNLNAVALVPTELNGEIASTGFDVLRPSEGIDARWLNYLVRTDEFVASMSNLVQGALYPAVRSKDVRSFVAPVAPSDEQTRIADKLDTVLTRVQACWDRLDRVSALLKRFRQAVLAAATSGGLTSDWEGSEQTEHTAESLLSELAKRRPQSMSAEPRSLDGLFPLPHSWRWTNLQFLLSPEEPFCYGVVQPGHDDASGVFLVRAGDLKEGTVNLADLRRIPASVDVEHRRSRLRGGEVLVTVVGAGIGESSIAPPEVAGFNIARAIAKLPVREVSARYVHLWLLSATAIRIMKSDAREVARPTLNLEQLKTLPVPIPPLSEQSEIVRRAESLLRLAGSIEARYSDARMHAQRLNSLLLGKAFRGELVPQDPRDEPAGALLSRIAAQRDQASSSTKARQPRKQRAQRGPQETHAMTKSRHDNDVMGQPYLAQHLRRLGAPASAEALFKLAELPVADFYKQLAWEVAQGHVKDQQTLLAPGHAA